MDSLHYSLGGCYPFRSVMADVHRITLYYDMVVQYTDCQCQLLGNDFAGQCSNLDMCLNNDHHGMDECKRSFGQKQSLVCQSSFTGYYYTYQFSVNDGNLRRECHIVCSSHKHPPFILCGTLVWVESKKSLLSSPSGRISDRCTTMYRPRPKDRRCILPRRRPS